MDEVDLIIDRARRQDGGTDDARELHLLVSVVDALVRGGLGYAMEYFRTHSFDQAAQAGRRLGADELSRMLAAAADIVRSRRGFELDRAIADWDERHGATALVDALHAAVSAGRVRGHAPTTG